MKVNILDVHIDNISKSSVLKKVLEWLRSNEQHTIFTPNPEMLVLASRDKEFARILNSADLLVPDGFGLILASWFLKTPFAERITGVGLVQDISKLAHEEGKKIFLLGGQRGIGERTAKNLKSEIINHKSEINWLDGVEINPDQLDKDAIKKINGAKPDILFVALGYGKQEKFIYRHLRKLPSVKIAIGVGGALDFIAGKVLRAPTFFQKFGFEWLWRLAIEPWRLGRIINAVLIFPIKVFLQK